MLALTIIFGLLAVAGWSLFFVQRRQGRRNYQTLTAAVAHFAKLSKVGGKSAAFWCALFWCCWVFAVYLSWKNRKAQ